MGCKYPTPAYNKRVQIQSPGGTSDAYGERATTWTTVATVWAAIMQPAFSIGARELLAAGALHGELTHRVQVRYTAALAAAEPPRPLSMLLRLFWHRKNLTNKN